MIIIFDFDGTLCDSHNVLIEQLVSIMPSIKDKAKNADFVAGLRHLTVHELLDNLNISKLKFAYFLWRYGDRTRKAMATGPMFSGMHEVLEKLSLTNEIYVLTSNSKEYVEIFLKRNSIFCVKEVYSQTELFSKDKSLLNLIKKKNWNKDDVIYVGDELRDIDACKKAGVKIMSVTWGFNSEDSLKGHEPDFLAHTPYEIQELLKGI